MGRPKGSRNISHAENIRKHLQAEFGAQWDPVIEMAKTAIEILEKAETVPDKKAGADILGQVAKFTTPQLKAIEVDVSNSDGSLSAPKTIRLIPVHVDQLGQEMPHNAIGDASGAPRGVIEHEGSKQAIERAGAGDTPGDDRATSGNG